MNPEDLKYTKEHEWIRVSGDTATVGITAHATDELGDVVYVEFPSVGAKFDAGKSFGTVESVKAVSELFMPVSGEIIEVNTQLTDKPETLNEDPYGKGWLIRVRVNSVADMNALMSSQEYSQYTASE